MKTKINWFSFVYCYWLTLIFEEKTIILDLKIKVHIMDERTNRVQNEQIAQLTKRNKTLQIY